MSTASVSPSFMSKLKDRKEVAERTIAFRFEKPSAWTFKAGQFIDMTLLEPAETDSEGNTRGFSIASGPHEETLMVATRMRDTAFKRSPKNVPLETEMNIRQWVPSRTQEFSPSDDVPGRLDRSRSFSQNRAASRSRRVLPQVALPTGTRRKAVGSTEIELFRGEQHAGKQA